MTVKSLIKKLQKVDPNLPVVQWSCKITDNETMFGFSEYSRMAIIKLEKRKKKNYPAYLRDAPAYVESTSSNKKAITAVLLDCAIKPGSFKKNKIG